MFTSVARLQQLWCLQHAIQHFCLCLCQGLIIMACGMHSSLYLKPWSHLADLTAYLSRPGWSGEVLWSRTEVGKEQGLVLEGPERSVNLVEVSPTIPDCFELFKTIASGRGWKAVVDKALGSRVRLLEGRQVSVSIVGKGRAWSGRN